MMVHLEGAVLQVEVLQLETITKTEILQVLLVHQEGDHQALRGVDLPVLQGVDHPVLQGVDHPVLQEVVLQREALQFQLQLDYQQAKETK